jgi:hypothetical protein
MKWYKTVALTGGFVERHKASCAVTSSSSRSTNSVRKVGSSPGLYEPGPS